MLPINHQLSTAKSSDKDFQVSLYNKKRWSIARLEDLSTELFYEIFDFLNTHDIFTSFSNLNIWFQRLLTCSSLPLKVNLSFISRRTFRYRCSLIVTSSKHQIVALSLSNHLSIELFLTWFTFDSSFARLEILVLKDIKRDKLIPLLTGLASLPHLFSLTIVVADLGGLMVNAGVFYHLIFRLPVLKSGNFLFKFSGESLELSVSENHRQEYSTIEHLVVDSYCSIDQFSAILSYLPQLRRLSCEYLSAIQSPRREIVMMIPPNLTHISIKDCQLSFDEFETFIFKFGPQLQLLCITKRHDKIYLNADRWERLISHHMPRLHIFDLQHINCFQSDIDYNAYHATIEKFSSSFWLERDWFFAHQHYSYLGFNASRFYSTRPFRRNCYDISQRQDHTTCSYLETDVNLAQRIVIDGFRMLPNCSIQYPRVNELVLGGDRTEGKDWLITDLHRIVPLAQITILCIQSHNLHVAKMIEILCHVPNLDSLQMNHQLQPQTEPWSTEQQAQFAHVMSDNKITKLIISNGHEYPVDVVQFLMDVCSRLRYLQIDMTKDILEWIVRLVLSKNTNERGHNLFRLLIWNVQPTIAGKLHKMIDDKRKSHNEYSIEFVNGNVHLWW